MYRIQDKEQAIRAVQRNLLIISQRDESLPHITVDGIYNEETRFAVSEFQRGRSLIATGAVDKETFDLLVIEANEILLDSDRRSNIINESSFPLRLGDSNNDVSMLNTILDELSEYYLDITEVQISSFFSRATESGVKTMQRHLREKQDGEVTIKLFDRLREELNARKNFRKPS